MLALESATYFNGCFFKTASTFAFPIPYNFGTVLQPVQVCSGIREQDLCSANLPGEY